MDSLISKTLSLLFSTEEIPSPKPPGPANKSIIGIFIFFIILIHHNAMVQIVFILKVNLYIQITNSLQNNYYKFNWQQSGYFFD